MENKNMIFNNINTKAKELVEDIVVYSDNIPSDDLLQLKRKMRCSVKLISPSVKSLFQKKSRIDKIRGIIEASSHIEECIDYLTMSKKLKYGKSDFLISRCDELNKLIKSSK